MDFPEPLALIPGGFDRVWISYPRGGRGLFANQQGGYRARCPVSRALVTGAFASGVQRWVEGLGPRALPCPACGAEHALENIVLEPPGAFGTFAFILADVSMLQVAPLALAELEERFGPLRSVLRRVS